VEARDQTDGGSAVLGRGSGQRKGMTLKHGVLLSVVERGRGDTLSVLTPGGPWAELAAGPFWFPEAFLFSYFFFIFLFCFLFYFLSFCKNASSQFKTISKFL
jgi:hypothetical protein